MREGVGQLAITSCIWCHANTRTCTDSSPSCLIIWASSLLAISTSCDVGNPAALDPKQLPARRSALTLPFSARSLGCRSCVRAVGAQAERIDAVRAEVCPEDASREGWGTLRAVRLS